ncbi:hypothetical protein TSOC_005731 [Tetrabaena socialis]|uniref:Ankyrin repeat domain-containing protein n=1 Tax=Tetrabaena socialis TaxID=47790 RepID=A0A2J8A5H0_9CHLO|nr:hypothetical protein TSOC_005731 [Tetrabaena socialis]|eukprot:PNH07782.1 hypothetical protein TSOC_005731 [Tetrabaena socialis]
MWQRRVYTRRQACPPASPPPQLQHHAVAAASSSSDPSRSWLPEIVERFAKSLTPNEVAGTLRLVNKASAAQFRGPKHTTIRLSQPVPHHAFVRRWAGPGAMHSLARKQRRELLCLTARSGVIANLELLLGRGDMPPSKDDDIFRAAASAGHKETCGWLLAKSCPEADRWKAAASAAAGGHVALMDWLLLHAAPLMEGDVTDEEVTLMAGAANGCDLRTLQRLHHTHMEGRRARTVRGRDEMERIISAAAGSLTADWQAKVEWLEARGYPRTASSCDGAPAACAPDALPRMQ